MKRLLRRFLILACCSVAAFAPSYFYVEYKSKQMMEVVIEQNKLVMENRTRTEILRAGINYAINGLDQLLIALVVNFLYLCVLCTAFFNLDINLTPSQVKLHHPFD